MQVTTFSSLNCWFESFIINSLHKLDDTLTFDCILYFRNALLLSCSVHSCMHLACVWMSVYAWAGRTHFKQKLAEFTNINFWVCPRKQVRSLIPTFQLTIYWTNAAKTFASSSIKWVRKIKAKIIEIKKRYALRCKPKNLQRFLKTFLFK